MDLVQLRRDAALFKPKMIVMGGSAYPRRWDVKAFRKIADENGALLMFDMAHIAGLVATEEAENPFEYVASERKNKNNKNRARRSFYRSYS